MTTGIYKRTEYHNAISKKNGFQKGHKLLLGKNHTEFTKQKISNSKKGQVSPMKGKKHFYYKHFLLNNFTL